MKTYRAAALAALGAGLLLIAACGGDDSATETSLAPTPTTATTLVPPETLPPLTTPSTVASTTTTSVAATNELLTTDDFVVTSGLGPVRIGMTLDQASEAVGAPVVGENVIDTNCFFARVSNGPAGVNFMVWDGSIARIDVMSGPITTRSGAGIGMTEQALRDLFPGQIEETPHGSIDGGRYMTFIPRDDQDAAYRVVFETDGNTITQYRAGLLPQVEFRGGCLPDSG